MLTKLQDADGISKRAMINQIFIIDFLKTKISELMRFAFLGQSGS